MLMCVSSSSPVPVRSVPVRAPPSYVQFGRFRFGSGSGSFPVRVVPVRVVCDDFVRFTGSVRKRFGSAVPVLFAGFMNNSIRIF